MELSFSRYKKEDWQTFQHAVADYFHLLRINSEKFPRIIDVRTVSHGKGVDEGVDILLTIEFDDTITKHKLRWVIQCKCIDGSVGLGELNGVNIPTLIHSRKANGYLLVCKGEVTSGITKLFAQLNKTCRMKYKYEVWPGVKFLKNILDLNLDETSTYLKQFFNDYHLYLQQQKVKIDVAKKNIDLPK